MKFSGHVCNPARRLVCCWGSLAEGLGNRAADVDLLVLVDDRDAVRRNLEGLAMQAGRAVEALLYRNGVEINLEIFVREDVERLMTSFVSLAPALYNPVDLKRLPLLQAYDVRFLHRLRTGWTLRGEPTVEMWRDEFMTELLATYLAVRHLNNFDEFLEDAQSLVGSPHHSCVYVGRLAVEFGLFSILAHEGFTNPGKKWLLEMCAKVQSADAREVVDLGVELLLGDLRQIDGAAYLGEVQAFGVRLTAHLQRNPEVSKATGFMRERIHYLPGATPAGG